MQKLYIPCFVTVLSIYKFISFQKMGIIQVNYYNWSFAIVNQNRHIFEPSKELIDSLLFEILEQDQKEHRYDDKQEKGNQQIESSEHESSSGSIGQSHRQPDISYEELSK